MNVGENIRIRREARKLSQAELARRVGVTHSLICQIERGFKQPGLYVGREIARQLGCTVEDLFQENGKGEVQ